MDMQTSSSPHAVAPRSATDLRVADFDFDLPPQLIAQLPAPQRDAARLLVLDRSTRSRTHTHVRSLADFLRRGDLLVVNDTQVMPARLQARSASGGVVELLFVRPAGRSTGSSISWICLGKPARRLRLGSIVELPGAASALVRDSPAPGQYLVDVHGAEVGALMKAHGQIPLPPYIKRLDGTLPLDAERYQTLFARRPGAVAAPTAGLHFTPQLLAGLQERGVGLARLTLHVGPGTFLPVRCENVRDHQMDPEWMEIDAATAEAVRRTKVAGGRVIAVGTTTTRALESAALVEGIGVETGERWAQRYILPGDELKVVDALFTNFHLPKSTLLLLVAALTGRDLLLDTYREAVAAQYRFYSYGDAMLIL